MTDNLALILDGFAYHSGSLYAENVPLIEIASRFGTPSYVYAGGAMASRYRTLMRDVAGLDPLICYAVKANPHLAVIETFAQLGAGTDVVSLGEMSRALKAGVPASKIVFAGVGKSVAEHSAGLDAGIYQFNVESSAELIQLSDIAAARNQNAPVALRVNPDIDAATHAKITTGTGGTKFGVAAAEIPELAALAQSLPGIRLYGLSLHLGSQITSLAPYQAAYRLLAKLTKELRRAGIVIDRLDLGGGFAITYQDEKPFLPDQFAQIIKQELAPLGCRLIIEPGRYLVGPTGILLTRILYQKKAQGRKIVIVDAAMNDLLRPALYDAYHAIIPVQEPAANAVLEPIDIVGPVCETTDRFAAARPMAPLKDGDLLAICSAGAYGAAMASNYNSRLPAVEIMVRSNAAQRIKSRGNLTDLWHNETMFGDIAFDR